jgi:hypothetical protein
VGRARRIEDLLERRARILLAGDRRVIARRGVDRDYRRRGLGRGPARRTLGRAHGATSAGTAALRANGAIAGDAAAEEGFLNRVMHLGCKRRSVSGHTACHRAGKEIDPMSLPLRPAPVAAGVAPVRAFDLPPPPPDVVPLPPSPHPVVPPPPTPPEIEEPPAPTRHAPVRDPIAPEGTARNLAGARAVIGRAGAARR